MAKKVDINGVRKKPKRDYKNKPIKGYRDGMIIKYRGL